MLSRCPTDAVITCMCVSPWYKATVEISIQAQRAHVCVVFLGVGKEDNDGKLLDGEQVSRAVHQCN